MNNAGIDVAGEPATQNTVAEKTRHPSSQRGQPGRGKLLLVEDDEGDQLLTREVWLKPTRPLTL